VQGGGFRAVGVGGGVTGQGGDLIIVDDPVKNREEAESLTYRDKVWDWFTNDLYTRLEPGGAIIVIMTRWHKDDIVGRILESETADQWTRIRLPAEAEACDPLGRSEGAALCPYRYPLPVLADIHKVLGRDYTALYQQSPQPREGGMFKDHWFKRVAAVPAEARRLRWWDKGATAGGGDWTVGFLMAFLEGMYYIEDVVRGQWASGERDRIIVATAAKDAETYGPVTVYGPQAPGDAGKDVALTFIKMLAGYDVHTSTETGSKEVRAQPLAAQCEAGNVSVLKAAWTATLIDEFCNFPSAANDDQVDAGSHAFNKLALVGTVTVTENVFYQ
jgi:predicted phage terminase large subunit-like protein